MDSFTFHKPFVDDICSLAGLIIVLMEFRLVAFVNNPEHVIVPRSLLVTSPVNGFNVAAQWYITHPSPRKTFSP